MAFGFVSLRGPVTILQVGGSILEEHGTEVVLMGVGVSVWVSPDSQGPM